MVVSVYLRAISFGFVLSLATLVLMAIGAVLGANFLLPAIVFFGMPFVYLFNFIVPDGFIYQIFPDGGGPALIGISLVGALLQLVAIYSWLIYRFKIRPKRPIKSKT